MSSIFLHGCIRHICDISQLFRAMYSRKGWEIGKTPIWEKLPQNLAKELDSTPHAQGASDKKSNSSSLLFCWKDAADEQNIWFLSIFRTSVDQIKFEETAQYRASGRQSARSHFTNRGNQRYFYFWIIITILGFPPNFYQKRMGTGFLGSCLFMIMMKLSIQLGGFQLVVSKALSQSHFELCIFDKYEWFNMHRRSC